MPRALDAVFRHISGRLYEYMDLKPYLSSDVQKLDADQVKAERSAKAALFSQLKEVHAFWLNILVIVNWSYNVHLKKTKVKWRVTSNDLPRMLICHDCN